MFETKRISLKYMRNYLKEVRKVLKIVKESFNNSIRVSNGEVSQIQESIAMLGTVSKVKKGLRTGGRIPTIPGGVGNMLRRDSDMSQVSHREEESQIHEESSQIIL